MVILLLSCSVLEPVVHLNVDYEKARDTHFNDADSFSMSRRYGVQSVIDPYSTS